METVAITLYCLAFAGFFAALVGILLASLINVRATLRARRLARLDARAARRRHLRLAAENAIATLWSSDNRPSFA